MALDFAAGCIGGTAGILLGYPFDTVKVMMQTQQPGKRPLYTGTVQCIRSIVARESIAGLYRGLSSPIGGVALVNAIVFGVYGNVQRRSAQPDSLRTHCFAGTLAGLVQSVITSPMELTKTRMQMQSAATTATAATGPQHRGAFDCARHIYRTEGGRGLYRGFSITVVRDVPGFASYFMLYELMVRAGHDGGGAGAGALQTLLAGGLAGVGSWLLTMPIDVVKTRLQVDGAVAGRPPRYAGIRDCVVQSYKAEGWRFLTRGMSSTLLRAFLMNSVCFYVVAFVMHTCDDASAAAPPAAVLVELGAEHTTATGSVEFSAGGLLQPQRLVDGGGAGDGGASMRRSASSYLSAFNDAVCEQDIVELEGELYSGGDEQDMLDYYIASSELLQAYNRHLLAAGARDAAIDQWPTFGE